MGNESVEMWFADDPKGLTREYRFRVRISQKRLLNKYRAVWCIVKYLWKVVRYGK